MPVQSVRIASLDVLRGFALLGILFMNIQSFSMPGSAYLNPYSYGDMQGANYAVWLFSHIFADQKFMSLFSMLFGVGVLVFTQGREKRLGSALGLHYRRCFWLLVFGMMHAYLLWYGDILVCYALCGFLIYWMRNVSVKWLWVWAVVMLAIASLLNLAFGMMLPHMPVSEIDELRKAWAPDATNIAEEIKAYTAGFASALEFRAPQSLFMQTTVMLTTLLWRALGMMLIGMALFKSGFFYLQWPSSRYRKWAFIGLVCGFTLIIFGIYFNQLHQFSLHKSMFIGSQFNYWGSVAVAIGYASLMMLYLHSTQNQSQSSWVTRLAEVGRMAFTNYIAQTLLCTSLFYYLGFYGQFSRFAQLVVVLLVCAVQVWFCSWWLTRFQQGPLEWCWRSLTYFHRPRV